MFWESYGKSLRWFGLSTVFFLLLKGFYGFGNLSPLTKEKFWKNFGNSTSLRCMDYVREHRFVSACQLLIGVISIKVETVLSSQVQPRAHTHRHFLDKLHHTGTNNLLIIITTATKPIFLISLNVRCSRIISSNNGVCRES